MNSRGIRVLLASSTFALAVAGGACKLGDGSDPGNRGSCDVLIECAASFSPSLRDEFEARYGADGSCWGDSDPGACRDACKTNLQGLAMSSGESCGTCSSNAECSEFGAGAVCDAGYCVGGWEGMAEGESGNEASGDGDGDGDASGDGDGEPLDGVSIILVVDNSGSMGEIQATLTARAPDLVAPLEAAGIPWRLGITTTDNGNDWCPPGTTTPEGGKFVFSSCTTRLSDFLFGASVDVQSNCTDVCNTVIDTVPTTIFTDDQPESRPWIESSGGQTNLANGVSVTEALRCLVPQGVNGCGFESPLEAAQLSIARAGSASEREYGFLEQGRLLVVVFVSDEADCSYNKNWSAIFSMSGAKTFWSDPQAAYPTSAVCWNAGVECIGDPSAYSSCEPADKAIDGSLTSDPDAAVMLPVQRYIEGYAQGGPVRVFGVLGVGNDGLAFYGDVTNTDPEFQHNFGIGPGCQGAANDGLIQAVPPVRMRSVLDQLGPQGGQAAYSVCAKDFNGGLAKIGAAIAAEF